MNFCAKCYQETFAIPKALSVQDLEKFMLKTGMYAMQAKREANSGIESCRAVESKVGNME